MQTGSLERNGLLRISCVCAWNEADLTARERAPPTSWIHYFCSSSDSPSVVVSPGILLDFRRRMALTCTRPEPPRHRLAHQYETWRFAIRPVGAEAVTIMQNSHDAGNSSVASTIRIGLVYLASSEHVAAKIRRIRREHHKIHDRVKDGRYEFTLFKWAST